MAGTLLVPGYVDAAEIERIARFIAEIDPEIPYSLLGFSPHFYLPDPARISLRHAVEAEAAAHAAAWRGFTSAIATCSPVVRLS